MIETTDGHQRTSPGPGTAPASAAAPEGGVQGQGPQDRPSSPNAPQGGLHSPPSPSSAPEGRTGAMVDLQGLDAPCTGKSPIITGQEISPMLVSLAAVIIMVIPGIPNAEVLGAGASVLAFAMFIPQALRVWRVRNDPHALLGVSVTSYAFVINNAIVWGIYAAAVNAFWVGAAGIVNLPLSLVVIGVIVRSRLIQRRALAAGIPGSAAASPVG